MTHEEQQASATAICNAEMFRRQLNRLGTLWRQYPELPDAERKEFAAILNQWPELEGE